MNARFRLLVDFGTLKCLIACRRIGMVYEWDEGRAKRARLIKVASLLALTASAISVPIAVLMTASPF